MTKKNSQFMQLAIDEAWKYQLQTYPNPAVGCCIVKDGKLLSIQAHKEAGKPHAEVLALKEAYLKHSPKSSLKNIDDSHGIHQYLLKNHNNFFTQCEIFVTLEPCNHIGKTPACAMLLEALKVKKVYIGSIDPNKNATGGIQRLKNSGIEVEIGLLQEQTDHLIEPFKLWQKGKFVFFKLAMREDGSIDGGYITTKQSLEYVHKIRSKLDLLVIGGNTVRVDRPTLDARYTWQNKAPNILILSKQKEFDKTIPLFGVKNRTVKIGHNFSLETNQKFVMIEGGYKLLHHLKKEIDYLVVFISHKIKSEKKFDIESLGFQKVKFIKINDTDTLNYFKKTFR
jgi:diaminohydroxyphosphoribosylaminopyrimidine deaminase/5-amino-6-(5-phosphoribosylamino)uracil reductase